MLAELHVGPIHTGGSIIAIRRATSPSPSVSPSSISSPPTGSSRRPARRSNAARRNPRGESDVHPVVVEQLVDGDPGAVVGQRGQDVLEPVGAPVGQHAEHLVLADERLAQREPGAPLAGTHLDEAPLAVDDRLVAPAQVVHPLGDRR